MLHGLSEFNRENEKWKTSAKERHCVQCACMRQEEPLIENSPKNVKNLFGLIRKKPRHLIELLTSLCPVQYYLKKLRKTDVEGCRCENRRL